MTIIKAYGMLAFNDGVNLCLDGDRFYVNYHQLQRNPESFPIASLHIATQGRKLVSISGSKSPEETCVVWETDDGTLCTRTMQDTASFMFDKLCMGRGS